MAFQSVPDTVETVVEFTAGGQPMNNVLNWEFVGGYTQSEVDALALAVDTAVDNYWMPLMHVLVNYVLTHARGLDAPIDLEAFSGLFPGVGAASGTPMPNQQSWVLGLGTGATGRSARGRIYTMPTGAANVPSTRNVTSGFANAWVDAIADTMTDVTAACGAIPVVVSRYTANALRPTGVTRAITDIIASNLNLDTQRRRVGK